MVFLNDKIIFIKKIEEYNPNKKRKLLLAFDYVTADMLCNKTFLLNISLVFITQSYFKMPKHVRLNTMLFLVMKIPNKKELQQILYNHSSDLDFIMNLYRQCTTEPYSFLVIDATYASDNPLRFRKNL